MNTTLTRATIEPLERITVTLTTAGFYNLAHEFRAGQPTKNKNF